MLLIGQSTTATALGRFEILSDSVVALIFSSDRTFIGSRHRSFFRSAFFLQPPLSTTIFIVVMYDEEPVVEGVGLKLPPPAVDPDDPLLIAQTLTYVTDDGSVLLSFTSAPFSFGENN